MLPTWLRKNELVESFRASFFPFTRHKVTGRSYGPYKFQQLKRTLALPLDPSELPKPYGLWLDERIVEYPWVLSQLPEGPGTLLDAGSVLNYDFVLRHRKLREKGITIMTLAPEAECFWHQGISYVYGDLRRTFFRDSCFDCIVSLSTIEHIGLDNTQFYTSDKTKNENDPEAYLPAILEMQRVLKPGGSVFISVPFGKRSVRSWLQIFDGGMVDRIITTFQPKRQSVTYFAYSTAEGWQLSTRIAAADAGYFDPSSDSPWPGSPAAAGAVACLSLTK
jgi:hypothetical protein